MSDYYVVESQSLSDVADAIREKTGGTADLEFPDEFVSEIGSISGGGEDEWAWLIGDGNTHIFIDVPSLVIPTYTFTFSQTVGGAVVSWGDGTSDTYSNTGSITATHTYSGTGAYQIDMVAASGSVINITSLASQDWEAIKVRKIEFGEGVASISNTRTFRRLQYVYFSSTVNNIASRAFNTARAVKGYKFASTTSLTKFNGVTFNENSSITTFEVPSGITTLGNNDFSACSALYRIVLPDTITTLGNSEFFGNNALQEITIPPNVTVLPLSLFYNCYALPDIVIPSGVTTIGNACFVYCYSFVEMTIPSTVTSIGPQAFYGCSSLKRLHVKPTTPPTLDNTNAFQGVASDFVIYVPQGSLSAYQSATNWSTYASKMQEEPT